MKWYRLYALVLLFACLLSGCGKDAVAYKSDKGEVQQDEEIVFEQGLHPAPRTYKINPKGTLSELRAMTFDDENYYKALGASWGTDGRELDYNLGLKASVLNLKSIAGDSDLEGAIQATPLGKRSTSIFTRNLEERTEDTKSKVVNPKFGLNLGVLKIPLLSFGVEYKKVFREYRKRYNNNFIGQADIAYYHSDIRLLLEESVHSRIIEKHLLRPFQLGKYTMSMGAFSSLYAPFTIVGYRSGAKLSAMFMTTEKIAVDSASSDQTFKSDFNFALKGEDKEGKPSVWDMTNGSIYVAYNKNAKAVSRVLSIGGNPSYSVDLPIRNATDNTVNISNWVASIADPRYHKIVDILDQGLIPTSALILEENFRRRFVDIHKKTLVDDGEVTPKLTIAKVFVRTSSEGETLCDVVCMLQTRNGDHLILTPINYDATDSELKRFESVEEFKRRGKDLTAMIRPYFKGLKISGSPSKVFRPYLRTTLMMEFPFTFSR